MSQRRALAAGLAGTIVAALLIGQAPAAPAATETLTVDLGTSTGAFHGGANGFLYGVYGAGVPTNAVLAGAHPRTLATKAQDGPQHPGADALEVAPPFVAAGGKDVYIYMTDIYRGFPYEWPTRSAQPQGEPGRLDYLNKVSTEVQQVKASGYAAHVVYVPYNEPEGNMFGTGPYSYDTVSWLTDPTAFFAQWKATYQAIKALDPTARIAGPNTSVLYPQVKGFLQYARDNNVLPDVVTWHELSGPSSIRTNVATYRRWETDLGITPRPINLDEYAYRYHLSVPGQMIQWMSAIEDSKVDADLAYWNIDGNLDDTTVEANKGNGQWWLLNAYGQMTGNTVSVTAPHPNVQYTLQGIASLDTTRKQARVILGGTSGAAALALTNIPGATFGSTVHVEVQEIPWTGQVGDSRQPLRVLDRDFAVTDGRLTLPFSALNEMSAYQVIVSPGGNGVADPVDQVWANSYEAENATLTGTGWNINTEGTATDLSQFAASGTKDVGGFRTGATTSATFSVSVPTAGTYDLRITSNSNRSSTLVSPDGNGPNTVFLRVDGANPVKVTLPVSYGWVVFDSTRVPVTLSAGTHTLTIAEQDPTLGAGQGDALLDKIDLSLANPALGGQSIYEAENAELSSDADTDFTTPGASGAGTVKLAAGHTATFWVHSPDDSAATVAFDRGAGGTASVTLNGRTVPGLSLGGSSTGSDTVPLFLSGGINQVTVTATSATFTLDRLRVTPAAGALTSTSSEAEAGTWTGTAATSTVFTQASGGAAVVSLGNSTTTNDLTVSVTAPKAGPYALTIRYANNEFAPATHYNPDPVARHADLSVNGGPASRVLFPNTFHWNQFRSLTVPVTLSAGTNTLRFSGTELPNWDGVTYNTYQQRSPYLPNLDKITVTPLAGSVSTSTTPTVFAGAPGTYQLTGPN